MNPTERFYFDARTQEILEHLTIPFAIYQYIDKRVVTIVLSQGFCDEFGFKTLQDAYHAMDHDMYRATHPDDKTRVADAAYRFAAFDIPYETVYRTRTLKDSDYIILHAYGRSIYPAPGVRLCLTWYAYEGHFSEEQGTYESVLNHTLSRFLTAENQYRGTYYDYKTGLPNMSYFYELAEAGCKKMQEGNIDSAILFFDLTGLKQFNHRYGFAEGDHLIRAVGAILAKHFSSENCARFAQDHFATFAAEEGLKERLDAVIEECSEANGGKTLPLRIGVYPNRIEPVEIGTACDRARLAADSRKKQKDSGYAFFDMNMMAEEKNRQEIIDHLNQAIEEGWIKVYYQPIVRATSGKVCDLEALARWDDPVRGLLPPSAFIPVLEEAGLIHKLDLCVVQRVLADLQRNKEINIPSVPISINFSRADFDACDLVQEIADMVDRAQIERKQINIEITESMVGRDFDYMKEQIERFRAQGFQVWMDDFGSGYSSLDVLQRIKFDLIKFDMSFMKRLDEGENGKIILKEMMRMATSLGVDTICEGVETEAQVRFLREIGCSKLQGFYFMKPVPVDRIEKRYFAEKQNGFEDPRESDYFDAMGIVNLYDLSFLANMDDSIIRNTFDTVPMGIMEVESSGEKVRYVRSNQAFREFMSRTFGFDLSDPATAYSVPKEGPGSSFMKAIEQSRNNGNRAFVDEEIRDGAIVRSFVRRIAVNQVTGTESVAIGVLSITEPDFDSRMKEQLKEKEKLQQENALLKEEAAINRRIAELQNSVSSLLTNMPGLTFSKDVETGRYLACNQAFAEYANRKKTEDVAGLTDYEIFDPETAAHFVEDDKKAIDMDEPYVFFEDVPDALGNQRQFQTTKLKFVDNTGRKCLLGLCQDVTEVIRARRENASTREAYEEARNINIVHARLQALLGSFICVYIVDPETENYREFSAAEKYSENLKQAKEGTNFFEKVREVACQANYPGDLNRFLSVFTKENVLAEIKRSGVFTFAYRLMIAGKPVHVQMKAAMVEEKDGPRLIVSLNDIDAQVRQAEEMEKRLEQAQSQAHIDALTGIKNKHAYLEAVNRIDRQIAEHRGSPFAIVIMDVNELKKVNDTAGHQAGDQYLRGACKIICDIFKHSPVYRVGGDEFAVIAQGVDYSRIEKRLEEMKDYNAEAMQSGGIVIACGMAKFEDDPCVATVFERADQHMYENKNELKGLQAGE